jgi:hypothetical protein
MTEGNAHMAPPHNAPDPKAPGREATIGLFFGAVGGLVMFCFTYYIAGLVMPHVRNRLRNLTWARLLPDWIALRL